MMIQIPHMMKRITQSGANNANTDLRSIATGGKDVQHAKDGFANDVSHCRCMVGDGKHNEIVADVMLRVWKTTELIPLPCLKEKSKEELNYLLMLQSYAKTHREYMCILYMYILRTENPWRVLGLVRAPPPVRKSGRMSQKQQQDKGVTNVIFNTNVAKSYSFLISRQGKVVQF